ncbi:sulfite exporter TauE/SafE family protein [Shewanella surugensis]|uniref:Probable membrane transporter protein n=1 Tax=Shewanella surugensis TaxID=212020 RepID=A0ABT0L6Y6_9GAMM|nr:sulfite exporter TauE/SafE family protein [Shewanella surugensis]MCL1123117.1 sulfite exporter TauE/SafE family protein [Shewanella surugensis]
MEIALQVFGICLVLGVIIGFLAGLLGIGGGLISVPALLHILPLVGVSHDFLPHVAIATSLAAIILTGLSSTRSHHKRDNIPWYLFKPMLPGFVLGSLSSGFISENISANALQQSFAIFVILMAIQMVFPFKGQAQRHLPSSVLLFMTAVVVAIIAGLMGIGGSVLLVPFLTFFGLQMRYAIGFSAASGLLIALFGSVGYVIAGWNVYGLPQFTLGYIYIPALLGIVVSSIFIAPIGAKRASTWPTGVLKKMFALLLVIIGFKLVFTG